MEFLHTTGCGIELSIDRYGPSDFPLAALHASDGRVLPKLQSTPFELPQYIQHRANGAPFPLLPANKYSTSIVRNTQQKFTQFRLSEVVPNSYSVDPSLWKSLFDVDCELSR